MKYCTVLFLFCCIAVAAAGKLVSTLRTTPVIFDAERHVKFNLHRINDFNNPHMLQFNSTVNSEWVNRQWETVIYIHGWIGGHALAEVMQKAHFSDSNPNINLIEVNWLRGAYNPSYFPSARRVPSVGEAIAKFIGLNQEKFNLELLTIVGHSLGAHAAGFAGKYLQSKYKLTPHLIIALDPAGPLFHGGHKKLQPSDAQNVLAIHTCQALGHLEPLGTIDVYINGGKVQPGCSAVQSHSFAKIFYRELVNGKKPLVGYRYSSFAEVKGGVIPKSEGLEVFHGVPFPPNGTLLYVGTDQSHLIAEVVDYISPVETGFDEHCQVM